MALKSKPAAKAKSASLFRKSASKGTKYVFTWGAGRADGDGSMKPLLGGKGANLAEMTRIGLPVPPGFTITTEVCTYYYANKRTYPQTLQAQMEAGLLMALETPQGRADQMARSIEVFGRIVPFEELLADLRAVDVEAARAAGAAMLDGRIAISSVGARLAAVA